MIFALVDCNNFYVACEQLFQPAFNGRPVVVLSNNDGCVVSRSPEAKALGIAMGAPWHTLKELARRHGVTAFSSNYALYADMSARVMRLLSAFSPVQDVYSIDECFLDLAGAPPSPLDCARQIRQEVKRRIGLPVCVGLGPTKTLAKLANHVAKKQPRHAGVFSFHHLSPAEAEPVLAAIPVGDVWGVGSRLASRLNLLGIATALDLKRMRHDAIRRAFNVCLARTVRELNGEVCFGLMVEPARRQQIFSSRSFGRLIGDLASLEESVAAYATRAAEKLRQQKLLTGEVGVLLRTNPFRTDLPQYQRFLSAPVPATDDTRQIAQVALRLLRTLYREGFAYQKTGVQLTALLPAGNRQIDLFDDPAALAKSQALMAAMDRINRSMGRGTIRLLAEGKTENTWTMRAENRSLRYTTRLEEVPLAKTR